MDERPTRRDFAREAARASGDEEARRLHVHFLATYSPWLNPIEGTWRVIKGRSATNRWRDSLDDLAHDFSTTMTELGAHVWKRTTPFDKE